MIRQNFLIALIGLPSSGKSRFAQVLANVIEKKQKPFKVKIIDPDKIRESISSDIFDYKKEKLVREHNLKAVEKALEEGYIVISDDLNYYTSMRHDLKEIADDCGVKLYMIHIATPIETCLKWNEERGKTIPNDVIKKINKKFDVFEKYNWDFPDAKYDLSQIINIEEKAKELMNFIERDLKDLGHFIVKKKYSNNQLTIYHEKLDRISRNIVGILLKNSNFISLKKDILKTRKFFVKENLNKSLKESEISKSFKIYLEKRLKIKI